MLTVHWVSVSSNKEPWATLAYLNSTILAKVDIRDFALDVICGSTASPISTSDSKPQYLEQDALTTPKGL
jgi:hypothetical protein